jgi:hypothetical protein
MADRRLLAARELRPRTFAADRIDGWHTRLSTRRSRPPHPGAPPITGPRWRPA